MHPSARSCIKVIILSSFYLKQIKVNSDPLNHHAGKNEEMPDKMAERRFHQKRNNSYGIKRTAGKYPNAKRKIGAKYSGKKHNSAPTKNNIHRNVNKAEPFRSKNSNQTNTACDYQPLNSEKDNSKNIAEKTEQNGSKG